jgi:hypothetical protein
MAVMAPTQLLQSKNNPYLFTIEVTLASTEQQATVQSSPAVTRVLTCLADETMRRTRPLCTGCTEVRSADEGPPV